MSQETCKLLATKQELKDANDEVFRQLRNYIPKTQEAKIIQTSTFLAGGFTQTLFEKAQQGISRNSSETKRARETATKAARSAKGSGAIARAAREAAKKNGFDVLYAQTLASSAKANAANNAAKIGKALGALGAITSIIGTLATGAALAALTQQLLVLTKRISAHEEKTLELHDSNFRLITTNKETAQQALSLANENKIEIEKSLLREQSMQTRINENYTTGQINKGKLDSLETSIKTTNNKIDKIPQQINQANANLQQQINQANANLQQQINQANANLQQQISQANANLQQQIADFKSLNQERDKKLKNLEDQITKGQVKELIKRTRSLDDKVTNINNDILTLKGSEINLKSSLEGFDTKLKEGLEINSRLGEGDITKLKEGLEIGNRLTNDKIDKLKDNVSNDKRLTDYDLTKLDNKFNEKIANLSKQFNNQNLSKQDVEQIFDAKINNIPPPSPQPPIIEKTIEKTVERIIIEERFIEPEMTSQDAKNINAKLDNLNNKVPNIITPENIALAVVGADIFRQILQKSNRISPCQAPTLIPPVAVQTRATNATLLGFQSASLTQTTAIGRTVNTTRNAVTNAKYGLQAAQEFGEKAWKATRLGKILEYLSLAATIHNGAMLSRNLGGSLGDIVSAIANNTISLIKNEEFQDINVNETLGKTIEDFLKDLIGAENYTGASETLSKYNRIINSASNVIYSITSIQAGLAEGLETVGNYTGKIGNALKKSGAVLETSYTWMSEKTSVKTGRLGKIQRVIDFGESAENVGSDIQNATEEFREAQENVTNIGNQYNQVKEEFTTQEVKKTDLETTTKVNSQGSQPELTDFVRDSIEEED